MKLKEIISTKAPANSIDESKIKLYAEFAEMIICDLKYYQIGDECYRDGTIKLDDCMLSYDIEISKGYKNPTVSFEHIQIEADDEVIIEFNKWEKRYVGILIGELIEKEIESWIN